MMDTLIDPATADGRIARSLPALGVEHVALLEAPGRILREAVEAESEQPPFDRVMMDGIAIRWSAARPASFPVAGAQMAGMSGQSLSDAGSCIEVTTGAILPEGCDCVIPVEQTRRDETGYALAPDYQPTAWQFVHRRGVDCARGSVVLEPGVRIGGPEMSLLASNGVARVAVARIPSVAIVATGDELADVDAELRLGQIRRSNDVALLGALRSAGFDRVSLHHVVDDERALDTLLGRLLRDHDVLVLSGGVSMGQRDHVPSTLAALGVEKVFHGISQRPGKPMWFGMGRQGQAVFALPGNPVSSLVCMTRYVRPALLVASGLRPPAEIVRLADDTGRAFSLTRFLPARVHSDASGVAVAQTGIWRNSGDFTALAGTQGFVELPPGSAVAAGTPVQFHRW